MEVAVLLRAGQEVAAGQVALASGLTMAKFAAAVLAIVLALVALVAKWRAR